MKKILLFLMMSVMVSVGAWASPSVDITDGTATITNDDGTYLDLSSDQAGVTAFGADTWEQIKACTTLKFVGKFSSLEGFGKSDNVNIGDNNKQFQKSVATTVDLKDAVFQDYSRMSFKPWGSTLEKLITPKDPNAYVTKDMFEQNQGYKLEEVVFSGGEIRSFGDSKPYTTLKKVSFPEETIDGVVYGVSSIGANAFKQCLCKTYNGQPTAIDMEELILPGTLTHIGNAAFFQCDAFEKVVMNSLNGTCTIGDDDNDDGVFAYCSSLKHATLSEGVTAIGKNMFKECILLESVRIPTTASEIKAGSFNLCASLHELIIPEYSGTGSQKIYAKVFENSGLTDIYVMAKTQDKIPQILSLGANGEGDNATFLKAQAIANTNDPSTQDHRNEIEDASDDKVLSWYTDEMSNAAFGRGGGDCLVILHYPDIAELKTFYDGANTILDDGTSVAPGTWLTNDGLIGSVANNDNNLRDIKLAKINEGGYISSGYAVGSEVLGSHPAYQVFGPSASGKYWPTRIDYDICVKAGATTNSGEFSRIGWRQLPIKQTTNEEDYIFTKKYDNTWYTMCFPWDMDDNTLFRAFNQKCEIAEFVGVELTENEESTTENKLYDLVFHFDRVAPTSYVTENRHGDGRLYVRTQDGDPNNPYPNHDAKRSYQVPSGQSSSKVNFYTYKCIASNTASEVGEYIYMPEGCESMKVKDITDATKKAIVEKYQDIRHLIAKAGHPYMIHPAIGAKTGHPADCTFAGVKLMKYGELSAENKIYYTSATDLAEKNYVTQKVTTGAKFNAWDSEGQDNKQAEYTPQSEYVFVGNPTEQAQDMLTTDFPIAYYLGAEADQAGFDGDPTTSYPKYYRKKGDGKGVGKWSPYTAIIRPLQNAQDNIEAYIADPSSSTNRNVVFGEWEEVTPTAIEEIISEAEANNQEVKKVNYNVVFSVNGQVVRTNTDCVEGLPTGLYIVNGKKYMVK